MHDLVKNIDLHVSMPNANAKKNTYLPYLPKDSEEYY